MIDRALAKFWARVARSTVVPDRSLQIYRWILGFYLLLFDAPHFSWIDRTPDAFFNPPVFSLAYLVGSYPPTPFFAVVDVVAIVAICTMTVGYKTWASTAVVLGTRLVGTSFAYATGKISHQIMISLVLLCMLVAGWGERGQRTDVGGPVDVTSLSPRTSRRSVQGLALLGVLIVFGFFAAGFEKVLNWVNFDTSKSGFLEWYYPRSYDFELRLFAEWVPGVPLELLKLGDIVASTFEVVGIVALLGGAIAWRAWLSLAVVFHLANALVLNITFSTQAMVYLAFVSLTFLDDPRITRFRRPATYLAFALGAWHVWSRVWAPGSGYFLWDGSRSTYLYDLYMSIPICVVVLCLLIRDLAARRRTSMAPAPEQSDQLTAPAR